ncbi:hypothetical protein D3C71_1870870 [compost metagenome]
MVNCLPFDFHHDRADKGVAVQNLLSFLLALRRAEVVVLTFYLRSELCGQRRGRIDRCCDTGDDTADQVKTGLSV